MYDPDLTRLLEVFTLACERYREELSAFRRFVMAGDMESEASAEQRRAEQQAYENYREALLAYLSALSRKTRTGEERGGAMKAA